MGWKQWALLKFDNKTHTDKLRIHFADRGSNWGWTFKDEGNINTRNPISYDDIEAKRIEPQTAWSYGHTGKQNEWAGMEARIEIWTAAEKPGEDVRICSIFYSCPWGSGNSFSVSDIRSGWSVESWGADYNGDALGSITITVRKN